MKRLFKKRFYKWIVGGVCALGLTLSFFGCGRTEAKTDARIVLTADIRGRLVPCGCFTGQLGGMTRLFTFLEEREQPNELRLDAGDALQGTADYEVLEYARILEAFNKMNFDALNIGAREAQLPADVLLRLAEESSAPLISANLSNASTNEPLLPTHVVTKVKGQRVVVTGVVHPTSMSGAQLGEGVELRDPALVLKERLPAMRKDGDILILLAFADEDHLRQLAEQFYELDFILGGDVSQPSGDTRRINQSQVFYVANESRTIGLIDFIIGPESSSKAQQIEITDARPVLLYEDIPEAPEVVEIADAYRDMIRRTRLDIDEPEKNQPAQVPGVRATATYVGTESCVACHHAEHAIWEGTGHAHAWASLKHTKADADPNCIGCHSVGFGTISGYRREFEHEKLIDVGCESCHGPGSVHVAERSSGGPIRQRFRPLAEGDCRSCHYGEFSRPFDWDTFWPEVAHGKKAEEAL